MTADDRARATTRARSRLASVRRLLDAAAGASHPEVSMKKHKKKLSLDHSTVRRLDGVGLDLRNVAGAMSGNVRCTQSGCNSGTCSRDVMGCSGGGTMDGCTGASVMWCATQMAACG
jgi:hypothetical protein